MPRGGARSEAAAKKDAPNTAKVNTNKENSRLILITCFEILCKDMGFKFKKKFLYDIRRMDKT